MTVIENQFDSTEYMLPSNAIRNLLLNLFPKKGLNNLSILDAGCRLGEYKRFLDHQGAHTIGVDINQKCISYCQSIDPSRKHEYLVANLTNLSLFDDSVFDIVLCIGVMPYLRKHEMLKATKELQRIVKKNGVVIVTFLRNNSYLVRCFASLLNLFPHRFYMNFVVPVSLVFLYPIVSISQSKLISMEYFKYGVLISLRNTNFGHPIVFDTLPVQTPKGSYLNDKHTELFIVRKTD